MTRDAYVGEIVWLRVGPEAVVPLLVTHVSLLGRVSGQVFTDPEYHTNEPWILENLFWRPSREQPTFLADNIEYGPQVGQWGFTHAGDDQRRGVSAVGTPGRAGSDGRGPVD
jgi:hypothetical protein